MTLASFGGVLIAASAQSPAQAAGFLGSIGGGILVALLVCWIRFPWVAVTVSRDTVRVRSWWSTTLIRRDELVRVAVEPNDYFYFFAGWKVLNGSLRTGSLVATRADGTLQALRGTATSYKVARQQAEELNRWLGLEVGAGIGERRSRSRRGSQTQ